MEALRDTVLNDSRHVWNDVRLTTSSTERASGVEKPSGTTTSPRRRACCRGCWSAGVRGRLAVPPPLFKVSISSVLSRSLKKCPLRERVVYWRARARGVFLVPFPSLPGWRLLGLLASVAVNAVDVDVAGAGWLYLIVLFAKIGSCCLFPPWP